MSGAKRSGRGSTPRRFKLYSAYKDSGVEWLGKVPEHWKESKVKFLGQYINGHAFKPDDWSVEGRPIIRIQNLTNPEAAFNRFAGDLDKRYRVTKGDILISWSASLGLFLWSEEEDGWLNQHIFKVVLRDGFIGRAFFIWLGDWFIRELQKETHGSTMTHLTNSMFGGFRVDLPPPHEQRAIAAFLDLETTRINKLVAKKERLIELLQEQRTSLITRAVTKGLDPNVPMKDSGVEWLGEIPAAWTIVPLKSLLRRCDYGISDTLAGVGDIRVLTMSHIQEGEVILPEVGAVNKVDERLMLDHGDLLFNRTNSRELVAKVGLFRGSREDRVTFASYLVRMTPTEGVAVGWLNYVLNSPGVLGFARGMALLSVNQANLNPTKYTQIALPLAPQAEQRSIAAFLDRETARIDALVAKVREAIDRLKELRTALISAAVTGKIDVRDEVA